MPLSTAPCLALLYIFALTLVARSVYSWRREEFRDCNQTPFCKQARAAKPTHDKYEVFEVALINGDLHAKILPLSTENGEPSTPLSLELLFYSDQIIRLKINELHDPSDESKRNRFEVPNVIENTLHGKRLRIRSVEKREKMSIVSLASDLEIVLQHKPFEIYVRDDKDRILSFNNKGLFYFEQRRQKGEGDDWTERFRTHTDSRPRGPQSISFDVTFHGADHVYGIPEHATSLALKYTRGPEITSEPYRLFNLDVFEYIEESPFGLYGSIPFMLSHSAARSTGFFWLNSAEMLIDVLAPGWEGDDVNRREVHESDNIDTQWMSESGIVDVFFFVGPKPKDLLRQYTSVTGLPNMPQHFATAYHQSRWNYKDEADVLKVDGAFDENDIPYDVLWLDIDHTEGRRYFTFDKSLFPNPKEMQQKLANKGRHMVTIVDPHIKRDDGFFVHKEATSKGYYVKDAHGRDFDGWCWPGSSSYPDMLNPEVQKWWAEKFSFNNYVGSTPSLYIWNDMNEPSVFNGPEVSMPRDSVHHGDVEHRDVHNVYGYFFHMATADGLLQRSGGKDRPFVLSRAFFAGSQKVGAVWTGDNTAEWDHLQVSVPMVLSLGITGLSFVDPELLTRWYQLAAYYPFFRAHAHLDTKRREPWLFGEPYTSYIRDAIRERYALLPYFYTLFREANLTGVPIMRPLWMEFPDEEMTFAMDKEWMVGNSLLIHGVYAEGSTSESVYLPGQGLWYELKTGNSFPGGDYIKVPVSMSAIPMFQRGGTIIPRRERPRRSSSQMVDDPYTLVIALNNAHEAEGEIYIDDGKTFNFAEGAYIHRKFTFSQGSLKSSGINGQRNGKVFTSSSLIERIVILGLELPITSHATVEPGNRRIELEVGSLLLRPGMQSNAYILRKPNVLISEDWSIKVL
ncbi:hypothetical protein KP509_29G065300 [Ceratopteris richardii]|uniref:Glucosidase II subunit alpha n=1 Tax=Ceratopteris richardii TaxID=49495 RepID=A0A8T2RA11_CERRI|nr:hypothetical protein KP509_29G065300 [Ceratopteris richardii]